MSDSPGLDPEVLALPSVRVALAERDIAKVYKILTQHGVSQRTIAALTGQSQSEVSEILSGRRVMGYDVLVRICTGFGIPRGSMGLAYDRNSEPVPVGEVDEEMQRRALLAAASVALFGAPVLGELLEIPERPAVPTPLPASLAARDVVAIKSLTSELRAVARAYGGCADTVTGVANRSLQLMSIPAAEKTRSDLSSALAELHTMAAWTCVDSGLHDNARALFATAMELSPRDRYQLASAMRHAGIQMVDAGAFNDALKAFQLGQVMLGDDRGDASAWMEAESALPLAAMGHRDAAVRAISHAREHQLSDPFDQADMDGLTSSIYTYLGRVEVAERFAASSVRRWAAEPDARRDSVEGVIQLAALHAHSGDADTVPLAHRAISQVTELRSVRARMKLRGLADAIETRPRSDFAELARLARQVATWSA